MKCSNPDCNRGIGLVAYQRGWFGKGRYCSQHCRDKYVTDATNLQQQRKRPMLKRFVVAFVAFIGLSVPITFAMAVLAEQPILVSETFANVDGMQDRPVLVGRYALRGVAQQQELFTLDSF